MTDILLQVSTRIEVADIIASLPTFQTLAGTEEVRRLEFPQFSMAIVGPFMLIQGDPATLAEYRRTATLIVSDLDAGVAAFTTAGGTLMDGPTESAGGRRSIVSDQDGNVFEVFQPPAS